MLSTATEPAFRVAAIIVEAGVDRAWICPDDARARGLTIVDLTDTWTPTLFAPAADGAAPTYRDTYLAFAAEHDRAGKPATGEDALGEPGWRRARAVRSCARGASFRRRAPNFPGNAAIDTAPIATMTRAFSQDDRAAVALAEQARAICSLLASGVRVRLRR